MNGSTKAVILIAVAIIACLGLTPFFSTPTVVYPIGDAYVQEWSGANYGTETTLKVGRSPPDDIIDFRSYLKFDLSTYATENITTVNLYLYWKGAGLPIVGYSKFDTAFITLIDDTWSEATVTWGTKPGWRKSGSTDKSLDLSDKWYRGGEPEHWIFSPGFSSIDITDWVNSEFSESDYIISIGVYPIDETTPYYAFFASREGSPAPHLEIEVWTPPPPGEYTLSLTVKDQCNNLLPASVTVDTQTKTCDATGKVNFNVTAGTKNVVAKIIVGENTYEASKNIEVTESMSDTITINRRFLWTFVVRYTDDTPLTTGTIGIENKETLSIPVTNGEGTGYLLDGTFTVTLTTSPSITIGTITVTNDQTYTITLTKPTVPGEAPTVAGTPTTEAPEVPVTEPPPAIPWVLLPTTHIYILTGVLVVIGIVAIVYVRRKRG